jgi:5'-phosphate synthase pdxT subunit
VKKIGVFLYQGAGNLHIKALVDLGFDPVAIDYDSKFPYEVDGLILPGGESSVQYIYCKQNGMFEKIIEFASSKKPILGTCAGAILLSNYTSEKVNGMKLIDIKIARNFYGPQLKSGMMKSDTGRDVFFIRAPGILDVGKNVQILDTYKKSPIFVKYNNIYCTIFHPELHKRDSNNEIYQIFNDTIKI